jgi:hypothetical protein
LDGLFLITGYFLVPALNIDASFSEIAILTAVFSAIALITIIIFLKGQKKEADSQTLYSLVALSLKFLLEIVFALFWFFIAKKKSLPDVLMFFLLYLALTLFSVGSIVKTLKNKAL